MLKIGTVFKFLAPNGWRQFQEGNRYVFHGPNQEELIVSGSLIQGIGATNDPAAAQRQLFENAEQSMKNASAHPALKVTQAFQQNARVSKSECWTLLARTHKGDMLFYQAFFRDPRGVLLATLEASNTAIAAQVFEQFINCVEVLPEGEAQLE